MTRLYRSQSDRKLCGVFGGLGEALDIDPNVLRIAAILLFFLTGIVPMVVAYVAACLLLPERRAEVRRATPAAASTVDATAEPAGIP